MNQDHPPVSVYIITHLDSPERGEVLKSVCENALALRWPEFEVVVSDNAGKLPAADVLASINDPRLKVFRNTENLGFAGNMNLCLERCCHSIIKLNCDDDLLHPDFLKWTVPQVDDETLVVCDYEKYIFGSAPTGLAETYPEAPPTTLRPAGFRRDFWNLPYISLPAATLFTRTLFETLGGYNPDSALPDWDMLIEARLRLQVLHVQRTLCYMGVWEGSLTEQMLSSRPFFFQQGWLFTKFRLLHDPALSSVERASLRAKLLRDFLWETMRLPRHFFRRSYWAGYANFARTFFSYMAHGRKIFAKSLGGSA